MNQIICLAVIIGAVAAQQYPGRGYGGYPNNGFGDPRYRGQGYSGYNQGQRYPGQYPGYSGYQGQFQGYTADHGATVLRSNSDNNEDGNFRYGHETSNGIQADVEGFVKNPGAHPDDLLQAIQGSYSHYTPDGSLVSVTYTADENGFKPRTTITRPGAGGAGFRGPSTAPRLAAPAGAPPAAAPPAGPGSPAGLYYGTNAGSPP